MECRECAEYWYQRIQSSGGSSTGTGGNTTGTGTGTATKRSYSGPAGENKVAISVSGTSVDVSGLFADGTTVYNWYDGTSATVSGGKVTFTGGSMKQPILVSDRNPAECGVTF